MMLLRQTRSLMSRRTFASVPETMKAAVVRVVGDADALEVGDYPTPSVGEGQVLVKNEFAGINFIDTYHRSGLYARDLPFVGGQEGGGEVAAVGAGVADVAVGDRVAYSVFGSYAEYTAVPAAKVLPVPDEVSMDVAVSCWAAQMAKIQGYKVIGTAAKGKRAVAEATGCDALILYDEAPGTAYEDYESVDGLAEVMKITDGVGCKAVIDGIGKATLDMSIGSLAQRGIFVSFGNASGAVPAYPPLRHIAKSSFMCRPKLLDYTRNREELLYRSNEIMGWLKSGQLKVTVDTAFPLDDAADGHKYLESGAPTGTQDRARGNGRVPLEAPYAKY
ncbi:hypothetical protein JL722_2292 [Aureococcus anophagefferens]|nr:hypothetical protein JL722_2292 [Aureococcus anophagefferens]